MKKVAVTTLNMSLNEPKFAIQIGPNSFIQQLKPLLSAKFL